MADDAVLQPTFGVEFEFFLITERVQPAQDAGYILGNLLRQPIVGHCSLPGCRTEHTLTLRVSSNDGDYRTWSAGEDTSLMLSHLEESAYRDLRMSSYCFHCEVRSRAFHYQVELPTQATPLEPDHVPFVTPELEIKHALQLINSVNEPEKKNGNLRVFTTKSCGLHVHVGSDIPSEGFDFRTVKNVLSLATVFERQFDSIHAVSRIGGSRLCLTPVTIGERIDLLDDSKNIDNTPSWCRPQSFFHAWRTHLSHKRDMGDTVHRFTFTDKQYPIRKYTSDPVLYAAASSMNALAWHQVLQGAQKLRELTEFYPGFSGKMTNVSIMHLQDFHRDTIEFRQHVGTLDLQETMAWVHTVVSVVKWCDGVDDRRFNELINSKWCDFTFSITDLLRTINAPDEVTLHYSHVTAPETEYARNRYKAAKVREKAHGASNPLQTLIGVVERGRLDDQASQEVRSRLSDKLLDGGYGLYPDKALRNSLTRRQRKNIARAYQHEAHHYGTVLAKAREMAGIANEETDAEDSSSDVESTNEDVEMDEENPKSNEEDVEINDEDVEGDDEDVEIDDEDVEIDDEDVESDDEEVESDDEEVGSDEEEVGSDNENEWEAVQAE